MVQKFCPRDSQIKCVNYELNIRAYRHLYGHLNILPSAVSDHGFDYDYYHGDANEDF